MRKSFGHVILLALLACLAGPAGQGMAMPQTSSGQASATTLAIKVKLKCGIKEDGSFVCKNTKKTKNGEHDDPKSSGKANKCEGKNDCGAGYRDLDVPNKYGACCEAKKDAEDTKDTGGAKTGKCMKVEKMSDLSCSAPFDAYSCGPAENGVMNCCCVK